MKQLLYVMVIGAALSAAAFAQPGRHAGPRPGGGDGAFLRAEFGMHGKVVTGAPYTAQAVTTFTQVLADGSHINRTSTGSIARDSAGRTRNEQSLTTVGAMAGANAPAKSVFIHDPVAGVSYVLDASNKVANMTRDRQRMQAHMEPRQAASEPGVTKESLGSQMVNGVMADGTRITRTIPAGQIGNEKAISIVTESWYSPELQTLVMRKTSDPRSGENAYNLTNINRSEPAQALFAPPADYQVQERAAGGRSLEFRHPQ